MHCVVLAAGIAQADGLNDALNSSDHTQIFTRDDDCTRDDQQRDYFILARFESCTADPQMKSEDWKFCTDSAPRTSLKMHQKG